MERRGPVAQHLRQRGRPVDVPPASGGAEHRLHPRSRRLHARPPRLGAQLVDAPARHPRRRRRRHPRSAAPLGRLPGAPRKPLSLSRMNTLPGHPGLRPSKMEVPVRCRCSRLMMNSKPDAHCRVRNCVSTSQVAAPSGWGHSDGAPDRSTLGILMLPLSLSSLPSRNQCPVTSSYFVWLLSRQQSCSAGLSFSCVYPHWILLRLIGFVWSWT